MATFAGVSGKETGDDKLPVMRADESGTRSLATVDELGIVDINSPLRHIEYDAYLSMRMPEAFRDADRKSKDMTFKERQQLEHVEKLAELASAVSKAEKMAINSPFKKHVELVSQRFFQEARGIGGFFSTQTPGSKETLLLCLPLELFDLQLHTHTHTVFMAYPPALTLNVTLSSTANKTYIIKIRFTMPTFSRTTSHSRV